MPTDLAELYERDYVAWIDHQVAALRKLAATRPNEPAIDWDRLALELEQLASSERSAVKSLLIRVIEHCLKLEHANADRPRNGWKRSVTSARGSLGRKLTTNLRRELSTELTELYDEARRLATYGLQDHDEFEAAEALPDRCPYSLEQLLADDWYPGEPDVRPTG